MRNYLAALTLLMALASSVWAIGINEWGLRAQPDGTTFEAHVFGDEFAGHKRTADGYEFVYGSGGWWYYAELDARGEYVASPYRVGIDDPASNGIPRNLQRSAARIAEINEARIVRGYARDPNSAVQGTEGDPSHFVCTKDNKCKAYVVLVTFTDKSSGYYRDDDQPSGYSWDLFNQFFNGGYRVSGEDIPAYKGTTAEPRQATGKAAETEAVFGSLRAYFDEVYGEDIIEFELLNRKDTDTDLPMWLQLSGTKWDYANLSLSSPPASETFWNDAEAAVRADDMNGDVLNPVPSSTDPSPFPFKTAPASTAATLRANKAIYVYAGLSLTNRSTLHPQVDNTTLSAATPGARFVVGERQGWDWGHDWNTGNPDNNPPPSGVDDTVDRFAGIGLHVHEWGHLFGFIHPDGQWNGMNPHPNPGQSGDFTRANIMGWGAMQDGAHGPVIAGELDGRPSNYRLAYRSCPNPYNPFYRMDLGWHPENDGRETIEASVNNKKIRPGPAQIYVVPSINDQDYLLDFRDVNDPNKSFGQYAAYKELSSSGLLIWRRETGTNASNPMLIPADGRSIFDARDTRYGSDKPDLMHNDLPSDPFAAAAQTHGPTATEATDATHLRHATQMSVGRNQNPRSANPDPGLSFLAFRNIEIKSDSEGAYAEVDIRFIPLPPTDLTASPVEGDDNAVTLSWTDPDQNGDMIRGYQYSTDGGTTWLPSLDAEPLTLMTNGATITGLADTDLTFQVRTVSAGIAPDNVSSASDAVTLDRPGMVTLISDGDLEEPALKDKLTATATDPNMSAEDWKGDDVSWQWQRRIVGVPFWTETNNISGATNASYELTAEDGGHEVRATVSYTDGVGDDEDTAASTPVVVPDAPPSADGPTSLSADENTDSAITDPVDVGVYENTDPNPNQPVWSLTGADADYFNLVQTSSNEHERTLQFKEPPNYEVPLADGGYKTTYNIGVKVKDVPLSGAVGANGDALEDILLVTVTVTNVEEAGSVTLSPLPPKVGVPLVAQLTDPDEGLTFTGASWAWERRADDTAAWESVSTGAAGATENYPELSSYTPKAADVGYHLRATVEYDDNEGPDKSAASAAVVASVPAAPALEATAGDGQVALTWTAPSSDGGSPILRYHVRYYKADLSDEAEAVWHEVPGGAAAQDTTIKELTNKKAYVFQVLAENAVGRGVPAEKEATPKAPRCSIAGPFAATVAENTPTTKAVATYAFSGNGCGAARWLALDGTDASAFALQGSGTARTLHFLSAPDYEAKRSYVVTVRILWGFTATYHPVRVTVSNVDEEGSVALSSTAPQVDHPVTATLTDPDGQITGASWTWQREEGSTWVTVWPSGASGTAAESYSELSSYTPQTADIGHRLQARVSYRDPSSTDEMDFRSAASDPTAAVLGKPGTPPDLEADPGDEQVALTWTAAEANGSPILRYHVRYYKADLSDQAEAEWHEVPGGAAAQDTTIAELANRTAYVFQVLAENAVGRGVWAEEGATPQAPACSTAGPYAPTVAENTPTPKAVATYAFSGNGCGAASWLALAGTDARAFELQGSGTARTLHFRSAPDYEAKNSYEVTVRIHWGSTATYLPVTVSVSNVEEAGTVALMGGLPPQEDRAVVAQLTDPDGQITGASWTWQRRSSATSSWEAVASGASGTSETTGTASSAELSMYTPLAQDVGWQIRASVAYTDGHGPNKSQHSDASAAVIGKPGTPQLTADPGDRQVALTWTAPSSDGGSSILRYRVRYYKADLSDQAQAVWHEVPGAAAAQDTTIGGLTNKKAYVFQVAAENAVGRGVPAEKEATPQAPVCSIAGHGAA